MGAERAPRPSLDAGGPTPSARQADGDTAVRLRPVSSAAAPSAVRAIAAPAPIAALAQSNPSPVPAGEPEASVGSLASDPVIAVTDE